MFARLPRQHFFIRGNDFDGMAYEFCIEQGAKAFSAAFYFENFESAGKIIGKDFFKKQYQEFEVTFDEIGHDSIKPMVYSFTLTMKLSGFDSSKAKMKAVKAVSPKLALMKKNYFAAPYEIIIDRVTGGDLTNIEFNVRHNEPVWVLPQGRYLK